jgi:hypothetical protein
VSIPYRIEPQPQVTTRSIGNRRVGIIDVPMYGGITTDEDTEYALLLADLPSALESAARLAEAWHVQHDMTRVEAYAVIQGHLAGITPEDAAMELILQHAAELEAIKREWVREFQSRRLAAVTALLRIRLGVTDQTIAAVRKLPRTIRDGLYGVWQEEQAAEAEAIEPLTEDDVKKPQPENELSASDGTKSSGSCAIGSPVPSIAKPTGESSAASCGVRIAACEPSNVRRLPLPNDPSPA